jgi:hypothetical protein
MRLLRPAVLAVSLAAFAACGQETGLEGRPCPCAPGYRCCAKVCVAADAFCPDAGTDGPGMETNDGGATDTAEAGVERDVPLSHDGPLEGPPDVAVDMPGSCQPGFNRVSDETCRPILFSDDFEGGEISDQWLRWRKTFAQREGRMNVGDLPRPGFNYGLDKNGRNAVLATHVGDQSWTDYRIDLTINSARAGSFNPYNLSDCAMFFSIEFRLARAAESWNEPALTAYSLGVNIPMCENRGAMAVGMDSLHDYYFLGPGETNPTGVVRNLDVFNSTRLKDGPNDYAIEVKGNTVKVWINGWAVREFTDDKTYPSGSSPIAYGGFQITWAWETLGWVDNVIVTDLK